MATLSEEQFKALLGSIGAKQNNAAVLGPMKQFTLGTNKLTRLKHFEEWLEEAENRMTFIGTTDDTSKIILLKSWGGPDLVEFMKTQARVAFETTDTITKDTYSEAIEKIKAEMQKLVNRTLVMHDLMTTKQGQKNWMEFIAELEQKAYILGFDRQPYTQKDAVKDAAIFGMTDMRLKEKALAEDPGLDTLIKWGQARETGKEGAHALSEASGARTNRLAEMDEEEMDEMINTWNIMKIRKQGRYSARSSKDQQRKPCNKCNSQHPEGRCPAKGKECFTCGERNHFSRTPACPKKPTTRRVGKETDTEESDDDYGYTAMTDSVSRVKAFKWPGVKSDAGNHVARKVTVVGKVNDYKLSRWVDVEIGGTKQTLYADTGSDYTIIPPRNYTAAMGEVEAADTYLRAWG